MPNNAHLSLFSGIGGLDLAAEWAGFRTVAFVERDKYCKRVLAKHWPGVPIYPDVAEVTADPEGSRLIREEEPQDDGAHKGSRRGHDAPHICKGMRLALLSGGFPCQPHSVAGKRKASADERDLWSECARITAEFRPRWAVFENVPGLLSSEGGTFFARVLGDLAALGYRVGWGVWGANDVGALHRRDRVFIVAHSEGKRPGETRGFHSRLSERAAWGRENVADAAIGGCAGSRECSKRGGATQGGEGQADHALTECFGGIRRVESGLGRGFDGISGWLDGTFERGIPRVSQGVPQRVQRLRALGNAVVPQQAYPIFKAIAEIEGINA